MIGKVTLTLAVAFSAVSASAASFNKRITGGENATDGEFPFIVSIHDKDGIQQCGGSLLDRITVLTAGHCVKHAHSIRAGALVNIPSFY